MNLNKIYPTDLRKNHPIVVIRWFEEPNTQTTRANIFNNVATPVIRNRLLVKNAL